MPSLGDSTNAAECLSRSRSGPPPLAGLLLADGGCNEDIKGETLRLCCVPFFVMISTWLEGVFVDNKGGMEFG